MTDDTLSAKAQELLEKFQRKAESINPEAPPQNNLFHYTSFGNFKRIVENKVLCFTHYECLNDPMEVKISQELLNKVVKKSKEDPKGKEAFWDNFFLEIFQSILDKKEFEKNKAKFKTIEDMTMDIYTFSFCEEKDYLPAWRWYGDDGNGMAIEFKSDFFKPSSQEKAIEPAPIQLKIIYGYKIFEEQISELIKCAKGIIKEFIGFCKQKGYNHEKSQQEETNFLNKLGIYLSSFLLPMMPGFKDASFQEEKEHRLCYFKLKITTCVSKKPYIEQIMYVPYKIPENRKKIRYRKPKSPDQVDKCSLEASPKVPYIEHPFSLDDIAAIWVGPSVDFKCREQEIRAFLNEHQGDGKYDIKIKPSAHSYLSP